TSIVVASPPAATGRRSPVLPYSDVSRVSQNRKGNHNTARFRPSDGQPDMGKEKLLPQGPVCLRAPDSSAPQPPALGADRVPEDLCTGISGAGGSSRSAND